MPPREVLVRYVWSVAIAIAAAATIIILHAFDLYPERKLAFAVLGVIADERALEALKWATVAIAALLGAGVYNFFVWRSQLARAKKANKNVSHIRNMTVWAAVDYMIEKSKDRKVFSGVMGGGKGCLAFSDAAERGDLAVEGRPHFSSDTIDIPHTYWRTGQLDIKSYLAYRAGKPDNSDGGATCPRKGFTADFTKYVGLHVFEHEVKRLWPEANT